MSKEIPIKVYLGFKSELDDIRVEKIKNGTANFVLGYRRITKAMILSSLWPEIKRLLINANIEDDRWKNGYK